MNFSDANLRQAAQSTVLRSEEKDGGPYDSDFVRIEELIKGNTFTREEITRLVEILNSRVDNEEDQRLKSNAEGDTQLVPWMPEILKKPSEGKHQYIGRTGGYLEKADVPVVADPSPIDIARAYMAGRTSEEGQDVQNFIPNSERAQRTNESARKPLLLPPPSPKPSICWPGALVHDLHGHTPQSQRARNRLHDFPRTPYSRTILSKSTTKLQADSAHANTSTSFQQSRTPLYGLGKLRGETVDAYCSVGPIRRLRNKFSSEVRPRGSIFLNSPKEIPPKVPTTQIVGGFSPSVERNLLPGDSSGVSKYWSGDNVAYTSDRAVSSMNISSSQAARKALELLDRNKPTPKQKEAELKLVTAQGFSPDFDDLRNVENRTSAYLVEHASHTSGSIVPVEFNNTSGSKFNLFGNLHGKGLNQTRDGATGIAKASSSVFTGSSKRILGADEMPVFGFLGTSGPHQDKNALTNSHSQNETSSHFSLPPLRNGQDVKSMNEPETVKNHGTKPSLPSISINRPELRAASSENGPSFTFPVSASAGVLSEPPTPSITPSSSAGLISQPIAIPSVPSYSFGTKNSTESMVFSFPSTSSASNHVDSDLKFSFGSDKKTRLSFSSFGTDAICY